jgi:signal-transduction protein with cAMP-binding, CBS, and nucleotidyltransferase domain
MTITEFLKDHVPFLKGLTEDQAHSLAQACEQKSFNKDQTVLFQGVSVDGLHVIAQGKVSVTIKDPKSKESHKVAELETGDVFGEKSIVEFTMAGATIKSTADGTLVFVIPEKEFVTILDKDPALKERTLALIEGRVTTPVKKPKKEKKD